ncbi:MAG: 3-deoxy-D-manno-octulosonic acid transferase [Rhodobacteraceae bacterium]|nr:3-deoxy-D-manno-octulosonic acid transferase [Paracoccaceae bacterium]
MADRPSTGPALRAYLAATHLAAPFARRHLQGRLARGKEDPDRWHEKRGVPSAARPEGPLAWLHAVGVGEVLALPGLARALRAARPDLSILITSSSRTSAEALAPNLPEGAIHQFLPLDIPRWRRRFLDHWRPDLSVWAERDLWPGFLTELARRGIPTALVNARMDAASARQKARASGLFHDLYSRFALIETQDEATARHIAGFGIPPARIAVTGSLKTAAAPLADRPERPAVEAALAGRRVWLAASTHAGEEAAVAEAHRLILAEDPGACLILAPRNPAEAEAATRGLQRHGIDAALLPPGNLPPRPAQAYVVDRIGQLGLWYRVAPAAFVGGSLDDTGGHNPWEPARLDCAILHGPNTWNFAADYAGLAEAEAARLVTDAASLAAAVLDPATAAMRPRAAALAARNAALPDEMARRLLALARTL